MGNDSSTSLEKRFEEISPDHTVAGAADVSKDAEKLDEVIFEYHPDQLINDEDVVAIYKSLYDDREKTLIYGKVDR